MPKCPESVPKCAGTGAQVLPESVPKCARNTQSVRQLRTCAPTTTSYRDATIGVLSSPEDPDAVAHSRQLLSLLNSAVRNTRGDATPQPLLERLATAWQSSQRAILLSARTVQHGVATLPQDGGWSFYAAMSGVASILLRPEASLADLQRLLIQLAQFRFSAECAEAFREWAWEEDGEAFDFELRRSFTETLDAEDLPEHVRASTLSAIRGVGAQAATAGSRRIASRALDLAASRLELDIEVSVESYARAAANREFEVDGAMMSRVTRSLGNPSAWATAELEVSLGVGDIRELDALRLARQLELSFGGGVPSVALQALTTLESEAPDLAKQARAHLSAAEVAASLLHQPLLGEAMRALAAWLSGPDPLAADVLREIVGKAPTSVSAGTLVEVLFRDQGVLARLREGVEMLGGLDDSACAWLAAKAPQPLLEDLLEVASADVAAALLSALPVRKATSEFEAHVSRVLTDGTKETQTMLAMRLADETEGVEPRQLATLLRSAATGAWSSRAATLLCARLQGAALARETLLPLARDRGVAPALRVAALRALRTHPETLQKACAWTLSELWAPSDVQRALRQARKELKEVGRSS